MNELHEYLVRCLASHREWIIVSANGRSLAVSNSEIDLDFERGRLLIGFPSDSGFQTWRVGGVEPGETDLRLALTRSTGLESTRIRLVPRTAFADLRWSVELARLERANRIGALLRENLAAVRLVRVELNRENGRFAQILFTERGLNRACIADVTDTLTPEVLLSATCFWLLRLGRRKRNPVRSAAIVAEPRIAARLANLHALLRSDWKDRIDLYETDPDLGIRPVRTLEIEELWGGPVSNIRQAPRAEVSETARRLIALEPAAIDSVFTRHGETVRFHGLPFARIRTLLGVERGWFGTERPLRPLTQGRLHQLAALVDEFRAYRIHGSPNRRHVLYDSAPEAWLESILRRDIRRLDANLILSPVYHQFRAERDKIDLLALRRDGRLVIIELKVEPDREMILQTVDYWRKIERLRRSGRLGEARLFGDLAIADAPAVCYLVAPTLAFHRDFDFSASLVSPEIEIHRFNLAEDWRRKLRVLERRKVV
jgi:hypothetical protein